MTERYGNASLKITYDKMEITNLVTSVEWSGDISQPYREVSVNLIISQDVNKPLLRFIEGKLLKVSNYGELLFVGYIFGQELKSNGSVNLKAYDENVYLMKNSDTRYFKNLKASDIIKRLCNDFGIEDGGVVDTDYVIPKMILKNKSLNDMIVMALTETRKQTGRRFYLRNRNGKVSLTERKSKVFQYVLETDGLLTDATYRRNIDEMKTRVKVIASTDGKKKKETIVVSKNGNLEKRYGIMQHVEEIDGDKLSKADAMSRANSLLKELATIDDEATVEVIGINDITAGTCVYVKEPLTNIVGAYWVTSDTHRFEGGIHTMTLKLSFTDDLPLIKYEGGA